VVAGALGALLGLSVLLVHLPAAQGGGLDVEVLSQGVGDLRPVRAYGYTVGGCVSNKSGSRGAGAERLGLPSGVRGICGGGTFAHWAMTVVDRNTMSTSCSNVLTSASRMSRQGMSCEEF